MLADVVTQLTADGCEVVVGTCPDLGTVRPILQPLREVARQLSRRLARSRPSPSSAPVAAPSRSATCSAACSGEQLDVMFGDDRFHPSAAGYANMVSVLIPAVAASLNDPQQDVIDAGEPRDVMSLSDAAHRGLGAAGHPGRTQRSSRARAASSPAHLRPVLDRTVLKTRWPAPKGPAIVVRLLADQSPRRIARMRSISM